MNLGTMGPILTGFVSFNFDFDYLTVFSSAVHRHGRIFISGSMRPISTKFVSFNAADNSLQIFRHVHSTPAIRWHRQGDPCWILIRKEVCLAHTQ